MVKAAGYTHEGGRKNNEDSYVIGNNFAVVADGMGGHSKGEVASGMAVEHIKKSLESISKITKKKIVETISSANKLIFEKAANDSTMSDMGTTVVMCLWDKNKVIVANVGDSRCYHCTGDTIKQITVDHSYVQSLVDSGEITAKEAQQRSDKNIILRAVGCDEEVEVDVFEIEVKEGDLLILCSDGLSSAVQDDVISKISGESEDVEQAVFALVDEANKNGVTDNVTAVAVKFE